MFTTTDPAAETRTRAVDHAPGVPGAYQAVRRRARDEGDHLRDRAMAGTRAARRALRRARHDAADAAMAAELRVRAHPFRAVVLALASGIVLGAVLATRASRRRAE